MYFIGEEVRFERGKPFIGSTSSSYSPNHPTTSYVKAIDARTGLIRWEHVLDTSPGKGGVGGVLSTSTGVVFAGYRNVFRAFDADDGRELWRINLGALVRGSPVAYAIGGKQYVAVAAGSTVFAFTLP
jgi:glucose dehydrogenase